MKKLLLTVAIIASGVVLIVASIKHYNDYKKTQVTPVAPSQEQQLSGQVQNLNVALSETNIKYNKLMAECIKGQNAYSKLTAFQKTQTPIPDCTSLQ